MRTVRELVPDPDRPNATIVRHRRYCAFRAMAGHARGLERDLWPARLEAVATLCGAVEIVMGAKPGAGESAGAKRSAFSWEVSEGALQASSVLRRAEDALGRDGFNAMLLLMSGAALYGVADLYRWPRETASLQVVALLDKLVDVVG